MYELETLTAVALGRLIDGGTIVVVPFGSIEHHGGHLPVGTDAMLADAVGREVARRLDAVLAPTVRVGCARRDTRHMDTMTLRAETLTEVAIEIAESLARLGFRVIVLLSTHGGNTAPLNAAVARLDTSLDDAFACAPRGDVGPEPGAHSGEWLTSVMLAISPNLVKPERADTELATELQSADAQRGTDHLERFVASIVQGVQRAAAARQPNARQ